MRFKAKQGQADPKITPLDTPPPLANLEILRTKHKSSQTTKLAFVFSTSQFTNQLSRTLPLLIKAGLQAPLGSKYYKQILGEAFCFYKGGELGKQWRHPGKLKRR